MNSRAVKTVIITVNYRNAQSTLAFLSSASRLEGFEHAHFILVDNDSGDDSVVRLRRASSRLANVEVLGSETNRGYFGGASWSLRHYLDRHPMPDWVVVCNNDVLFDDPRFLIRLSAEDSTAIGVIAPSVVSSLTGHDANPCIPRRPSRLRMFRYGLWISNYYVAWSKQWLYPFVRRARRRFSSWAAMANPARRSSIYAPHGSFLIFSRRFFELGGRIDDGFFLYAEEFCVAEMCRHLGLPVIHEPELRVRHNEHQTTGRMLSRRSHGYLKDGFRYALSRYENSYDGLTATPPYLRTNRSDDGCGGTHYSAAIEGEE